MPTAIDRFDIADYVSTLLSIYIILIFIRILMSWIPRMPYNPALSTVVRFIEDVTEPWLRIFRRVIPPLNVGGGGLDLSPMIATFALILLREIVANVLTS